MQPPIETAFVSATAATPPPQGPRAVSRTRVLIQRRTTTAVTGFCDGSAMGHLLGYARVSTTDQHPQLQVDALKVAGCYRVFTETASGARTDRPVLEQVVDQLRPGDTLNVWKLDRLGRSLRHLVDTITGLADRGIGFCSLQEAIDTTTPRRQARLPRLRRPGRVRTRSHPRTHGRGAGCGSGPRAPGWPS